MGGCRLIHHLDLFRQVCVVLVGSLKAVFVEVPLRRLRRQCMSPPRTAASGLLQPRFGYSLADKAMSGCAALGQAVGGWS